jgi:hypothetical protein
MSKPTILQQFRSFCYQNNATNLEVALEYFAVFGGMGWSIDVTKPLELLIEEKVFENYRYIHSEITQVTQSREVYHKILSALATGDRREHSAFKKAKVNKADGEDAVDYLIEKGLLSKDISVEKALTEHEKVSIKLHFNQPFMRFWFAAVSPYYKGIKAKEYTEAKERWAQMRGEFTNLIYQQLFMELIKQSYNTSHEDKIITIGSYWDTKVEIDLLAKTKSGKMVAGACKFSKSKANKSELTKLKAKCQEAELEIESYLIFSTGKFSTELKKERGKTLQLFSVKSLNHLLFELDEKDLLKHTNKMY